MRRLSIVLLPRVWLFSNRLVPDVSQSRLVLRDWLAPFVVLHGLLLLCLLLGLLLIGIGVLRLLVPGILLLALLTLLVLLRLLRLVVRICDTLVYVFGKELVQLVACRPSLF